MVEPNFNMSNWHKQSHMTLFIIPTSDHTMIQMATDSLLVEKLRVTKLSQ